MDPVISVNLNGNAYQIEQVGYSALRAYLDRAAAQLRGNPDAKEILADLEEAIADKFRRQLGPHKTVVTETEITQALDEMGPVDATGGDRSDASATGNAAGTASADAASPKRLYQVSEGSMITGVCQGLAMYLSIDVTIVRVAFILLTLITKGVFVGVYFILMVVIPRAKTDEEVAAAHGQPFNAREVIDQVKRNAASTSGAWRRQIREQRRHWRRTIHSRRWERMGGWGYGAGVPGVAAAPTAPLLHLLSVAWVFAFIFAGFSLFQTGTIFGWHVPPDIPMWAVVSGMLVLFHLIAAPLAASGPRGQAGGLLSLVAIGFVCWFMYEHVPMFHAFVDRVLACLESRRTSG